MSARTYEHALPETFALDFENTQTGRELAPTLFDVTLSEEDLADLSVMHASEQAHETEDEGPKTRDVTILQFNVGAGFIDVARRPSDTSRVWIHFSHADASVYVSLDEGFARALSMRLDPVLAEMGPDRRKPRGRK
jgi:hypothetical protein